MGRPSDGNERKTNTSTGKVKSSLLYLLWFKKISFFSSIKSRVKCSLSNLKRSVITVIKQIHGEDWSMAVVYSQ